MRSFVLARGRALTGCAILAAALAGCTSTAASSGSTVSGSTLTIYASKPSVGLTTEQRDVIYAEQLALHQAGGHVGKFTIRFVQISGGELSDNARGAIADPTTIAYLGELEPGTSGQTIGITNAQDILQVSPTDTAVELTQATPAVSGSPDLYYESLSANGRTFARVVPTDKLEAKALVGEMQAVGVKALYVSHDGSQYGKAIAYAVAQDARGASLRVTEGGDDARTFLASGADAIFLGAESGSASSVASLFGTIANTSKAKLFAPSALADDSFASSLSPAAQRGLYVSSPGFISTDLSPQFVSAFKAAYGHTPATEAIFGYEAMASVLAALNKAGGSANDRGTVVKDFFAIRNRNSPLGTYSIDKNGDISFSGGAPFVLERVKGGKLEAVQKLG